MPNQNSPEPSEEVTVDHVIKTLNIWMRLDRNAMSMMAKSPIPCNKKLANHPTVNAGELMGQPTVGILAVMNGLFGLDSDGRGAIAIELEPVPNHPDRAQIKRFVRARDHLN